MPLGKDAASSVTEEDSGYYLCAKGDSATPTAGTEIEIASSCTASSWYMNESSTGPIGGSGHERHALFFTAPTTTTTTTTTPRNSQFTTTRDYACPPKTPIVASAPAIQPQSSSAKTARGTFTRGRAGRRRQVMRMGSRPLAMSPKTRRTHLGGRLS